MENILTIYLFNKMSSQIKMYTICIGIDFTIQVNNSTIIAINNCWFSV